MHGSSRKMPSDDEVGGDDGGRLAKRMRIDNSPMDQWAQGIPSFPGMDEEQQQAMFMGALANRSPPAEEDAEEGAMFTPHRPQPRKAPAQVVRVDSARLGRDSSQARSISIPAKMASHVFTAANKKVLMETTGSEVEWDATSSNYKAKVWGAPEQVKKALRLLDRVVSHCNWGSSEAKVSRILSPPKQLDSVLVRLSPMGPHLQPFELQLSASCPVLSIGKEKGRNHVVIPDPLMSRQHCSLELDITRGSVYIMDQSTNGTFLNGCRLPKAKGGKVICSHGDDLVLKDPVHDPTGEFGYIVNISEHLERKENRPWEAGTWNARINNNRNASVSGITSEMS